MCQVWRRSDGLGANETLTYDSTAYEMYHASPAEWPCLSFDCVRDSLGQNRYKYPMTGYIVTGSQIGPEDDSSCRMYVLKFSELYRTTYDDVAGSGESLSFSVLLLSYTDTLYCA